MSKIWRHGKKEQTDSDQRGWETGIPEERRGRFKLRNLYKRPMDMDNRVGID